MTKPRFATSEYLRPDYLAAPKQRPGLIPGNPKTLSFVIPSGMLAFMDRRPTKLATRHP
jgi:hypothetical protein